jgi:hypothetical protein
MTLKPNPASLFCICVNPRCPNFGLMQAPVELMAKQNQKDNLMIKRQQKRDGVHPAYKRATGESVGQKEKVLTDSTNTADYVRASSDSQSGCDNARNGVSSA